MGGLDQRVISPEEKEKRRQLVELAVKIRPGFRKANVPRLQLHEENTVATRYKRAVSHHGGR